MNKDDYLMNEFNLFQYFQLKSDQALCFHYKFNSINLKKNSPVNKGTGDALPYSGKRCSFVRERKT